MHGSTGRSAGDALPCGLYGEHIAGSALQAPHSGGPDDALENIRAGRTDDDETHALFASHIDYHTFGKPYPGRICGMPTRAEWRSNVGFTGVLTLINEFPCREHHDFHWVKA